LIASSGYYDVTGQQIVPIVYAQQRRNTATRQRPAAL